MPYSGSFLVLYDFMDMVLCCILPTYSRSPSEICHSVTRRCAVLLVGVLAIADGLVLNGAKDTL